MCVQIWLSGYQAKKPSYMLQDGNAIYPFFSFHVWQLNHPLKYNLQPKAANYNTDVVYSHLNKFSGAVACSHLSFK